MAQITYCAFKMNYYGDHTVLLPNAMYSKLTNARRQLAMWYFNAQVYFSPALVATYGWIPFEIYIIAILPKKRNIYWCHLILFSE